jgi:hypothetical protein
MQDRVLELAQRRAELVAELNKVNAELVEAVGKIETTAVAATTVATTPETPVQKSTVVPVAPKQPRTKGTRGASLKEVVQGILSRSRNGLELKEIVTEVTRMIQNGEYTSKATNVAPVVQQALHQLKEGKLVSTERVTDATSNRNRNLYVLAKAAA